MLNDESRPSQGVQEFTWPDYIGWGWMIVQARMEADWKGIWNYALPHVHATEATVARAEAQLGFRLPDSYRGFLLASNGWSYFYLDMTAFSTPPTYWAASCTRPARPSWSWTSASRPWPLTVSSPPTTSP